jgi:hypothetical protein
MHITNLQIVLALFLLSNVAAYVIGRRHGRRS